MRICSVDGCDRKHVARGYCGSHYNSNVLDPAKWHRKADKPCEVCGTIVTRRADMPRRTTCSVACRTKLQWGTEAVGGYEWAHMATARARRAGCTDIAVVYRETIYDRDNWRCYICGIDTALTDNPFDPSSPTVDHVVPLSKGGSHTPENMRCACLHCNSSKGAAEAMAAPAAAS